MLHSVNLEDVLAAGAGQREAGPSRQAGSLRSRRTCFAVARALGQSAFRQLPGRRQEGLFDFKHSDPDVPGGVPETPRVRWSCVELVPHRGPRDRATWRGTTSRGAGGCHGRSSRPWRTTGSRMTSTSCCPVRVRRSGTGCAHRCERPSTHSAGTRDRPASSAPSSIGFDRQRGSWGNCSPRE